MNRFQELCETHAPTLAAARNAIATREFYARWAEAPSGKIYGETANADGEVTFNNQRGNQFTRLVQQGDAWHGEEESPYGISMGITYPVSSAANLMSRAETAQKQWSALTADDRAAVLIECLERAAKDFFEIGYATQHTTGQGFVMAFQASGPHSFDRALESVATGHAALTQFATEQTWVKPMGKISVTVQKRFHAVPKGVNVTIGCSTFPIWNSVPGMFASLMTGAATVAKVHPKVVYPLAILVASMQHTLQSLGLDPHIVQLGVPSPEHPLTMELIANPRTGTVDYTGSPSFGAEVERVCMQHGKVCFTEKAGVNTVAVESVENLDAVLDNLAFSILLYSGQMCTAPQNFFIPESGITTPDGTVSPDEFASRLAAKIDALAANEKMAQTFGAIQNPSTLERITSAAGQGATVIRPSAALAQPGFENARSVTPLLLKAAATQRDIYEREWFGPIAFVIPVGDFTQAITLMAESVRSHGALTTSVYSTNPDMQDYAERELIAAGAPVAFNFTGSIWINQSAAFSDFHGTGANPAGNASFADLNFVAARYNVIGTRRIG
ncbi:MAG: aldehyde dehydrogenase family protein [Candidatus Kapabacteria bacterium]|nr:aldehyde dehydrogenase family protein [Candidatus Kapabacteria bacterium]